MGPALDLEDYHLSVLLHCWLGHLTCKIVSEMTYNVSSGTLNPTIPMLRQWYNERRSGVLLYGDDSDFQLPSWRLVVICRKHFQLVRCQHRERAGLRHCMSRVQILLLPIFKTFPFFLDFRLFHNIMIYIMCSTV